MPLIDHHLGFNIWTEDRSMAIDCQISRDLLPVQDDEAVGEALTVARDAFAQAFVRRIEAISQRRERERLSAGEMGDLIARLLAEPRRKERELQEQGGADGQD